MNAYAIVGLIETIAGGILAGMWISNAIAGRYVRGLPTGGAFIVIGVWNIIQAFQ